MSRTVKVTGLLYILVMAGCGTAVEPAPRVHIKTALIPAGEFMMGSPPDEKHSFEGNYPGLSETLHHVTLTQPFRIGVYEITQQQWKAVMSDYEAKHDESPPWKGKRFVIEGPDYPATYISWDDAVRFCERLTRLERRTGVITAKQSYRLPTEAEWEYACRAGTTTPYTFGDDPARLDEFAVMSRNHNTRNESCPHPVGTRKPNPWGLYDLHGNVAEWCHDWSADYPPGDATDPQGIQNTEVARGVRVARGRYWDQKPYQARSAQRNGNTQDVREFNMGFRVVLSPVAAGPAHGEKR